MGLFGRRKPKIDPALEAALDREAEPRLVLTQWPLRDPCSEQSMRSIRPPPRLCTPKRRRVRNGPGWSASSAG